MGRGQCCWVDFAKIGTRLGIHMYVDVRLVGYFRFSITKNGIPDCPAKHMTCLDIIRGIMEVNRLDQHVFFDKWMDIFVGTPNAGSMTISICDASMSRRLAVRFLSWRAGGMWFASRWSGCWRVLGGMVEVGGWPWSRQVKVTRIAPLSHPPPGYTR